MRVNWTITLELWENGNIVTPRNKCQRKTFNANRTANKESNRMEEKECRMKQENADDRNWKEERKTKKKYKRKRANAYDGRCKMTPSYRLSSWVIRRIEWNIGALYYCDNLHGNTYKINSHYSNKPWFLYVYTEAGTQISPFLFVWCQSFVLQGKSFLPF